MKYRKLDSSFEQEILRRLSIGEVVRIDNNLIFIKKTDIFTECEITRLFYIIFNDEIIFIRYDDKSLNFISGLNFEKFKFEEDTVFLHVDCNFLFVFERDVTVKYAIYYKECSFFNDYMVEYNIRLIE